MVQMEDANTASRVRFGTRIPAVGGAGGTGGSSCSDSGGCVGGAGGDGSAEAWRADVVPLQACI